MRPLLALEGRDPHEEHRASTPLELFVDLCFVVAVAQAAAQLHHALAESHVRDALVGYPTVFFAIWWAWMNFTWFASAYDNEDRTVVYRLAVFVQVAGILILAAGIPRLFNDEDFSLGILGYVVMRLGLVSMWLLASRGDPEHRATTRRYAIGVTVVQFGWLSLLWLPDGYRDIVFLVLIGLDLAVPVWAERTGPTPWHPHHIAERYGLFTIIVLGESILSITLAVQEGVDAGDGVRILVPVIVAAFLTVCAMWWMYFTQPVEEVVDHARERYEADDAPNRAPWVWGYGHYVIFGSAAAVGAGYAVAVDAALHTAHLPARGVSLAVAVPVALFVVSVHALHASEWHAPRSKAVVTYGLAIAVLAGGILALPVIVTALLLVAAIAWFELWRGRTRAPDAERAAT
jgi:low temperature requirement protein LtrA